MTVTDTLLPQFGSVGLHVPSAGQPAILNHPAVFEAVVIGVPDEKWGEVPLALVVLKAGEQATGDDLKTHVRAHLAGFKVPKKIEFRTKLHKGGTGKIQKRELREPYWANHKRRIH